MITSPVVNDSVEKTFKSKAQMFKQLEVTEASLAGNSKFVLTEKGITPTLVFNESDKKIIPVEA